MPVKKDIWRVGISRRPLPDFVSQGAAALSDIVWLPEKGLLQFDADPFGLWRDGLLHLFVETYDYRDRVGRIDVLILDEALRLKDRRPALREPWHLSYPFIFEHDGEVYMLPEAFRSGRLTLYRARRFPDEWEAAHVIQLDHVPIDATPMFHEGKWWLFYTSAISKRAKVAQLHVAYADDIMGKWTPHPLNPVIDDPSCARPGGTPFLLDGKIILPVQDCSQTYGGSIRFLHISRLTTEAFTASAESVIRPDGDFGRYTNGLHTLSSAGSFTLLDAKRMHLSPLSLYLDAKRVLRKL